MTQVRVLLVWFLEVGEIIEVSGSRAPRVNCLTLSTFTSGA